MDKHSEYLLNQSHAVYRGGTIQILHMELSDSFTIEHEHEHNAHEVYFCLNGILHLKAGEAEYNLEKDSFIIIPPEMKHRVFHSPGRMNNNFLMIFRCRPNSSLKEDLFLSSVQDLLEKETKVIVGTDRNSCRRAIDGILKERDEQLLGAAELLQGYYKEFFTLLFRNLISGKECIEQQAGDDVNLAVQISWYLKDNYMYDLSVKDVADAAHITVRHADRLCREVFGMSVMRALTLLRVAYARRRIEDTDDSLEKIAYDVGFSSLRRMQQVFQEMEGLSAEEYRRILRSSPEDHKEE